MRAGATCALLCCTLFGVLVPGCGQMGRPGLERSDRQVFGSIESRLADFQGVEGAGKITVKRAHESIEVPFTLVISEDLVIILEGELRHFLVPFEGSARLVSTELGTVVHTSMGVFDVGDEAYPPPTVRAILLSAFMGGDGLVLWLKSNECEPGAEIACEGLDLKLRAGREHASVDEWEIKGPEGQTFKGAVHAYDKGSGLLPKVIRGSAYPDEIDFQVEYDDIHRIE
jgi:hypothetical protein